MLGRYEENEIEKVQSAFQRELNKYYKENNISVCYEHFSCHYQWGRELYIGGKSFSIKRIKKYVYAHAIAFDDTNKKIYYFLQDFKNVLDGSGTTFICAHSRLHTNIYSYSDIIGFTIKINNRNLKVDGADSIKGMVNQSKDEKFAYIGSICAVLQLRSGEKKEMLIMKNSDGAERKEKGRMQHYLTVAEEIEKKLLKII